MTKLFEPIQLKHLTCPNRIVRSATNDRMGQFDGTLTEDEIDQYRTLAENEVGLIISGHMFVSANGVASKWQNGINEDRFLPMLTKTADAIRPYAAKMIIQINHAGLKAIPPYGGKGEPVSTHNLCAAEIAALENDYIDAAYRARQAGFDGVQVHCAHGYLLSQFVSPVSNHRSDQYGGNADNRFRMPAEIIAGIKARCGEDFPIFVKITSNVEQNDEDYAADLCRYCEICKELGVEAVELSRCDFKNFKGGVNPLFLERTVRIRKQVDISLIFVGGLRSFPEMQQVLDRGIEMVSICRPFLSEPDLITKLKAGKKARCIACNKCYYIYNTNGKRCVFHEKVFPNLIDPEFVLPSQE